MGNIQHASAGLAGPTVRRHRGDESGRAEQTSHGSRLLRSKDTGRRGIGSGGVRRGLLAMQAGLASIPLHYPWIVDAQMALFREQLGKILEKYLMEMGMCWCVGAEI